jgi:hypothetical protein
MSDFEGFDGQKDLGNGKFWSRLGVDEQAAPGNGSLPPGATETSDWPSASGRKPSTKSGPLPNDVA